MSVAGTGHSVAGRRWGRGRWGQKKQIQRLDCECSVRHIEAGIPKLRCKLF